MAHESIEGEREGARQAARELAVAQSHASHLTLQVTAPRPTPASSTWHLALETRAWSQTTTFVVLGGETFVAWRAWSPDNKRLLCGEETNVCCLESLVLRQQTRPRASHSRHRRPHMTCQPLDGRCETLGRCTPHSRECKELDSRRLTPHTSCFTIDTRRPDTSNTRPVAACARQAVSNDDDDDSLRQATSNPRRQYSPVIIIIIIESFDGRP